MLIGVLLAWGVAAGGHPLALAVVGVAALRPAWFLAGVAGWAVWQRLATRTSPRPDEAVLLRAMAAELRAGASLRSALTDAAHREPGLDLSRAVRLAGAGRPAGEVAAALQSSLPLNGRRAAAAYRLASTTGAAPAAVFAALAHRAARAADVDRERRSLTAQARLSAGLVGGAPLLFGLAMAATGHGPGLDGARGIVTVVGLSLELAGAVVVWWMMRSAAR